MSCRFFSKQNSSFLHWKQRCIHYYYHIIIITTSHSGTFKWPYSDMVYTDWKTIPGGSKLKAPSSSSLIGFSYTVAGAASSSARAGSSRNSRSLCTRSSAVSVSGWTRCGTGTMSEKYDKPSIHCLYQGSGGGWHWGPGVKYNYCRPAKLWSEQNWTIFEYT